MKENGVSQEVVSPPESLFAKAMHASAQVAGLGHEAARLKDKVSHVVTDAIEDGKREAKRAIKRGYNAAEDLADEATHCVKRHPLSSVAVAFGAGAVIGALFIGTVKAMTRRAI